MLYTKVYLCEPALNGFACVHACVIIIKFDWLPLKARSKNHSQVTHF